MPGGLPGRFPPPPASKGHPMTVTAPTLSATASRLLATLDACTGGWTLPTDMVREAWQAGRALRDAREALERWQVPAAILRRLAGVAGAEELRQTIAESGHWGPVWCGELANEAADDAAAEGRLGLASCLRGVACALTDEARRWAASHDAREAVARAASLRADAALEEHARRMLPAWMDRCQTAVRGVVANPEARAEWIRRGRPYEWVLTQAGTVEVEWHEDERGRACALAFPFPVDGEG